MRSVLGVRVEDYGMQSGDCARRPADGSTLPPVPGYPDVSYQHPFLTLPLPSPQLPLVSRPSGKCTYPSPTPILASHCSGDWARI